MPRFRMEFSKGDPVRFLSHLDIVKAFERAIRRAEIPIAFSEGFNPHPRMSFASALAVGVTSDREYIDIELARDMQLREVVDRLARALPPGMEIKEGRQVPQSAPSLMARVNRAAYRVAAEAYGTVNQAKIEENMAAFLAVPEIMITKRTKKGPRPKNIRPGIYDFRARAEGERLEFIIETMTSNEGSVRPEEVIRAFTEHSGCPVDCDSLYIRRTGLYAEQNGELLNPMDIT